MSLIWLVVLLVVVVSAITTAWGAWRAAPYVPTRSRDVERMLTMAALKDGETIVDLGAGDGRILLTAAKRFPNLRAIGYELSLPVWLAAWMRIAAAGLRTRASIRLQDFFHQDLSAADVVFCFLTPEAMKKLGPKFKRELRPGTRIISAVFSIAGWTPEAREKPEGRVVVYRYRV